MKKRQTQKTQHDATWTLVMGWEWGGGPSLGMSKQVILSKMGVLVHPQSVFCVVQPCRGLFLSEKHAFECFFNDFLIKMYLICY